jgi:opacity protein-like surface antigen
MIVGFKKAALAVLALSVSGLASAGMYAVPPVEQEPVLKDGFYAGIGLGGINFSSTIDSQSSNVIAIAGREFSDAQSSSYTNGNIGLNSTIFGGYAWHLPKRIFLGAEIFGNLTNTVISGSATDTNAQTADLGVDITGTTVSNSADLTLKTAYGIRALPGYQVSSNAVIYLIGGWISSQAKGSSTIETFDASIEGSEGEGALLTQTNSANYDLYGYQVGLGSMINLTEHVLVRGDLIYSGYNDVTLVSGSAEEPGLYAAQGSVTADPSTLEADVSLVYLFD